ncbi:hypothetical protein QWZ06_12175 [Chryseobacterium tructae]|uniref:DUF3828 domain-containing protein n=1 Tax=Chryseobacterium tructae TaxID=1037380 RepID=A0ABV7XWU6_9FLAO|nr:hypothetical protein [Chryseobacterium tructae]MDN3692984.1 hypothetical protein [Chryseobacterium tructae]
MAKSLFFYLSCIVCFVSCSTTTSPSIEQKHISETVNKLYNQYGLSNEAIYNQPISNDLFSPELKNSLETAINASKADIEKVKNSDHPDEKPLIFEGALFSSLYEGYTHYTIKSITIQDKTAEVLVQFEYNMVAPKVLWTDSIQLTDSGKGWKIDNIVFDKKASHSKDLKTSLKDFIQYSKQ